MYKELNDKLWEDPSNPESKLLPIVRERLLMISDEFYKYFEKDKLEVNFLDIQIVGSQAGYNYTDSSDIDLHFIVNYDDYGEASPEIMSYAFNAVKSSFNRNLDIDIKGIPVEVYVQDVKSLNISNGIYSVKFDEWVKVPSEEDGEVILPDVSDQVEKLVNYIDEIIKDGNTIKLDLLIDKLYLERQSSLATDGLYGEGNLIFKELRKLDVLKNLRDTRNDWLSQNLSLEESRRIRNKLSKFLI